MAESRTDIEGQDQDNQQGQAFLGESNFSDGSEPLFSMYLTRAWKEDHAMTESWKGYAEGMVFFTGLFSASVAALLAVTIPDIRPSPQDTTNFYLAHIYQRLNESQDPIPPSLSQNPAQSFSAPISALWVNGLWFLSLVVSLTCALMATLLQQWARRYLEVAYPRCSPPKRARLRAFYKEGVEKLHVPWTVNALPALLHVSLFLFFAGLSVFLFNIHLTIFGVVTAWVGLCLIAYGCLTFSPIIWKNSPYTGPLSAFFSFCFTSIQRIPSKISDKFHPTSAVRPIHVFSHGMRKTAEDYASKLAHKFDLEALLWTFQSLDEDGELQKFFEGLLGLCKSKAIENALGDFINPNSRRLSDEMIGLMDRTLSSNLISESLKQRRITICTKVIRATNLIGDWTFLSRVVLDGWDRFLRCIEFGTFSQGLTNSPNRVTAFCAQCAVAAVIQANANVREREEKESWFQLVTDQLNTTPKPLLYRYLSHDDSILLPNLTFIVRRIVQTYSGSMNHQQKDLRRAASKTLKLVCKFDIKATLPELQHEFCGIWNLLAEKAENDDRPRIKCITKMVLDHTRKLYDALHHDQYATSTPYPRCEDPKHRCTSQIEELKLDEPPPDTPNPNAAHTPTPSAVIIPPSPGPGPSVASAAPASDSVASFHSRALDPTTSSQT